jgi:nicotinamidase-related amidase
MNDAPTIPRSPELLSRHDSALLVVDVQGRLITLVPGHQRIIWNIGRLIDGAKILGVPVAATEQYPQGLGPTTPELARRLGDIQSKRAFSCAACGEIFADFAQRGIFKILVAGIETHVCIQQTVLDLMTDGFRVYVAVDATGSRFDVDRDVALRRMDSAGATLTTVESALFEWCETSAAPEFKQLSALVQHRFPEEGE